jgi:hypothetical protein
MGAFKIRSGRLNTHPLAGFEFDPTWMIQDRPPPVLLAGVEPVITFEFYQEFYGVEGVMNFE